MNVPDRFLEGEKFYIPNNCALLAEFFAETPNTFLVRSVAAMVDKSRITLTIPSASARTPPSFHFFHLLKNHQLKSWSRTFRKCLCVMFSTSRCNLRIKKLPGMLTKRQTPLCHACAFVVTGFCEKSNMLLSQSRMGGYLTSTFALGRDVDGCNLEVTVGQSRQNTRDQAKQIYGSARK